MTTDATIPAYPFEPDFATGNKWFRIQKIDSFVSKKDTIYGRRSSDFLIPHGKNYYFLVFVKNGSSRHWIDMKPYVLKPNTFYFAVPQQVHLKEEARPLTGISISFTEEFLAMEEGGLLRGLPIIKNPQGGHQLLLDKTDLTLVEDLLEKIYAEYQIKHDWQNSMLSAYMKVLLIHLSRLYNDQFSDISQVPDKALLNRYLDKINESYARLHEVAAYVALLNISAGHLGDVVREHSGKPAIAHIHERLLVEARRLLFHTDLAAKEIAFELGFEDASYFNRFFKRLSGQTPLEYRNHNREMYH
jgi:AraC-like DNA-binding protein